MRKMDRKALDDGYSPGFSQLVDKSLTAVYN